MNKKVLIGSLCLLLVATGLFLVITIQREPTYIIETIKPEIISIIKS